MSRIIAVFLATLFAISTLAEKGGDPSSIPPETATNYIRTVDSIAGLTFSMTEREDWRISEVQFGIKDGHLMLARYYSKSPDGLGQYIDDSAQADALVNDTTDLPLQVVSQIGKETYEIRAFTLGEGPGGPDGATPPLEDFVWKPKE